MMIPKGEEEASYEEDDWTTVGVASFEEEWNQPENDVWDQFYEEKANQLPLSNNSCNFCCNSFLSGNWVLYSDTSVGERFLLSAYSTTS